NAEQEKPQPRGDLQNWFPSRCRPVSRAARRGRTRDFSTAAVASSRSLTFSSRSHFGTIGRFGTFPGSPAYNKARSGLLTPHAIGGKYSNDPNDPKYNYISILFIYLAYAGFGRFG